ncbi:MAG: hypothetical protein ACRDQ5_08935 [Sciscionella sp.]
MGSLTSTLDHAKERMTNANRSLKDSAPHDLGSADIDSAGAAFQDRWEYGIGKVAEFTGVMVESLTAVKKTYAEMEHKAAELFGQGSGDQRVPESQPQPSPISRRLDGDQA